MRKGAYLLTLNSFVIVIRLLLLKAINERGHAINRRGERMWRGEGRGRGRESERKIAKD